MTIAAKFTDFELTSDQQVACGKLDEFLSGDGNVFLLKGYAGSGKTTLLKGVVEYLKSERKQFQVMAPTGRAAKILRDKVGHGQTIHKCIYNFKELKTTQNTEDSDDYSLQYFFPIGQLETDENILIVDEASMVSSKESKNETFIFGSSILLDDLLTYSRLPNSKNKILFIGDPAQLLPVGDNQSLALSSTYFQSLGLKVDSFTLTEVVRQGDNTILANATKLRELLEVEKPNELELFYDDCFSKLESSDLASRFTELFPIPQLGQGVIIAYSNRQCLHYNRAIREKIFPGNRNVTSGDLLMIVTNNYHMHKVELMNGEMVKVMSISDQVITRKNIPVYETINGERIKRHVRLDFRSVTLRLEQDDKEIQCFIIDTLLNSIHRDLTLNELKALYVDFVMRFQVKQQERQSNGYRPFKVGSNEFKEELKSDPFFNALRVKYGYAITCHKSQGGEWETTFVDYAGRASLAKEPLRWSYTATTRASKKCFAANAPSVTTFSQFKINEVRTLTNLPANLLDLSKVPTSEWHNDAQHKCKSLKYFEVAEKLLGTPYQITKVESFGDYLERYTIEFNGDEAQFDTIHNLGGIFHDFKTISDTKLDWHSDLLQCLNEPVSLDIDLSYSPNEDFTGKLYDLVRSSCEIEDAVITNVEEHIANYFVSFFVQTRPGISHLQFYFNGRKQVTRLMPSSTLGADDEILNNLIKRIQENVI